LDWDTAIALAYAAEQLFVVAQALTSDLVSTEYGLKVADSRLGALMENSNLLPKRIREKVLHLHDRYLRYRTEKKLDPVSANSLSTATMSTVEDIRDVLNEINENRLAA
jgi:hypothetical protein